MGPITPGFLTVDNISSKLWHDCPCPVKEVHSARDVDHHQQVTDITRPHPACCTLGGAQAVREEKTLLQAKEHDERVRRAKERAAAPVFKKMGKPQMLRSRPLRAIKTKDTTANDLRNLELERYLAQDLSQL